MASCSLPARARDASLDLVFRHGFWHPPPPATLFLQRKLGGTFLLCVKLRGRVDVGRLLDAALERHAAARSRDDVRRVASG